MKTIKEFRKDGNRSVGIYQRNNGEFLAMTFAASKDFKTVNGAKNWLEARGYK